MNKKTFIIAIVILIIDQLTKSLLEIYLKLNQSIVIIKNFLAITLVHNTGGAWSILNKHSYILIIFSVIALILLFRFMITFKKNTRNSIAFALTISGIISNLADRIFLGYVRDFLDFTIFNYDYPIFNIADVAIVIGVILLIIAIIKGEDRNAVSKSRK